MCKLQSTHLHIRTYVSMQVKVLRENIHNFTTPVDAGYFNMVIIQLCVIIFQLRLPTAFGVYCLRFLLFAVLFSLRSFFFCTSFWSIEDATQEMIKFLMLLFAQPPPTYAPSHFISAPPSFVKPHKA